MENKGGEKVISSAVVNGLVEGKDKTKQLGDTVLPADTTFPHVHADDTQADAPRVRTVDEGEHSNSNGLDSREASVERKATGASATASTSTYIPPVKRFSAVNINKKFLEKNQSTSTPGGAHTTGASSSKQTGVLARPAPQSAPSHSRLVTAKLTATPLSTSPGPGWSRPNSVSPGPTQANAPTPAGNSAPLATSSGGHGLPYIPPGGKIIHPQIRNTSKVELLGGAGKPAWRSVQPGAVNSDLRAQNDFPTAAEAAQGRLIKLAEMKATSEAAEAQNEAQKQAMSETADAFRGVHLDPNAHHWDEMEEDDNDFLGGVIEFGDGRQYTIQVSDGSKVEGKSREDVDSSRALGPISEGPVTVSKAERFVDDFDRSWPRGHHEQAAPLPRINHNAPVAPKEEPVTRSRSSFSETSSTHSGHSPVSTRDGAQSRVLFNERLNRMEPAGNRPVPSGPPGPPPHAQSFRRGGLPDAPSHFPSNRPERDPPPHSVHPHVQVLQKSDRGFAHEEIRRSHPPSDSRRDGEALETGGSVSQSSGDGIHDQRNGGRGWEMDGAPSHPTWQPTHRESSVSRDAVNGTSSVASSDDHDLASRQSWSARGPSQRSDRPPHSGASADAERQLPPHLNDIRPFSMDIPLRTDSHTTDEPLPESKSSIESSRASKFATAIVEAKPEVSASPADVEALQKAFLSDSAERAKRRRQEEEEERTKAQERAKKKAAEIEAKLTAAEAGKEAQPHPLPASSLLQSAESGKKPSEAEVLNVIEEAIKSMPVTKAPTAQVATRSGSDTAADRSHGQIHSSRGSEHIMGPSDGPQSRRPPLVSDRAESWRAKAKQPVPTTEPPKNAPSDIPVMAASLPTVEAFGLQADECMEVFDFNEIAQLNQFQMLDKLFLRPDKPMEADSPPRPAASDFFDVTPENPEPKSWRRLGGLPNKPPATGAEIGGGLPSRPPLSGSLGDAQSSAQAAECDHTRAVPASVPQTPSRTPSSSIDGLPSAMTIPHVHPPLSPGLPRFPRTPTMTYREAPLSALDDTMSRIKGALDGMHSSLATPSCKFDLKDSTSSQVCLPSPSIRSQAPATPSEVKREKWLPPALRPQVFDSARTESFEFTRLEPPRSPAPIDKGITIRLPKGSHRIEPLTKKQATYFKTFFGPVRWEILSFDPPVEGMTKRNLSVNDILFRRPQSLHKSKKYRVMLPKAKRVVRHITSADIRAPPKVSLPICNAASSSVGSAGAFGRPRMADQVSWRNTSGAASEGKTDALGESILEELNITSRSPPPDLAFSQHTEQSTKDPSHSRTTSRSKVSQKAIDGSEVLFYRDARKTSGSAGVIPKVTFTVNSELEGEAQPSPSFVSVATVEEKQVKDDGLGPDFSSPTVAPATTFYGEASPVGKANTSSQRRVYTTAETRPPNPSSDSQPQSQPATPPPQSTSSTWGRSPARAPDPEVLKAVWSQASDRASIPSVNSLKGIADDLTAVPFSIHEVKSEGGTPPPPPGPVAPPSRMSASEVTRAFQTVPTGPSNSMSPSSFRANPMPTLASPMNAQKALRPTTIGLPPPPPPPMHPNAPRPHYMGYPSSVNSHTPSPPTLMYSHIMPHGMQASPGSTPYGHAQPVWMPLVHQQGPQMVRAQPSSPYSPSLIPYHVPGTQNGMYHPPNGVPNSQGSPAPYPSTSASQMMVSPVLPHAAPVPPHMLYSSSPMLVPMPPPGGTHPQAQPYPGAVGIGRGSVPARGPMDLRQPPPPVPPSQATRYPVHSPGYTHVPPQSFVRPTW